MDLVGFGVKRAFVCQKSIVEGDFFFVSYRGDGAGGVNITE